MESVLVLWRLACSVCVCAYVKGAGEGALCCEVGNRNYTQKLEWQRVNELGGH